MCFKFGNYHLIVWILCFLCYVPQQSLQSFHQRKLLNDLFQTYSLWERPVINDDDTVILRFSITLMKILKVDTQKEVLLTNMWLSWNWNDANLRWDPKEYGNLTDIHVPAHRMWIPDVLMYNNADDYFYSGYDGTNVIINNSGNCTYITPGNFKSTCKIDTTWFPFDEQKCEMKFGSWTYDGNQLDLRLNSEDGSEDLSNLMTNGEWEVKSFTSMRNEISYACCPEPYVDITFMLSIKRQSVHYVYNVIIPSTFVALCGLLVFILPPESGSKLIFGIATLVLLYLCQCNFSQFRTPSTVPLIDIYFSYLFTFNLISLVSSVFVLNVHYSTSKMPQWIRSLFVERLPRFLLIKSYRQKIIHKSTNNVLLEKEFQNIDVKKSVIGTPENESRILTELQKLNDKFQRDELVEIMKNDWKIVAMVMDRILVVIFATFFIIVTIRTWVLYKMI